MNRVVHFEIHADDIERCKYFYSEVFGWTFEDYTEYVGSPYFGIITGPDEAPGINGGLIKREKPLRELVEGYNSYVCTLLVEDYDEAHDKILAAGGKVVFGKHALPGMAWQGYYQDTEGNEFGIHQPDEEAM